MPGPNPWGGVPARLALCCVLAGTACSGAPSPATNHFASATITVTDRGLEPGPDAAIPAFGTVVWRNASATDGVLELVVERPFEPSEPCATTLGFHAADGRSAAWPIAPGELAALCFHAAGRFAWRATLGGRELRGTIRVGGAP